MSRPSLDDLKALPAGSLSYVARPDGTRLRCIVTGDGPTVVLAHGVLCAIPHWNLVTEALVRRGHRVVVFDQRGHAGSTIGAEGMTSRAMAGDYVALLDAFACDDAVLVGHSMGAFLSVVFSILHPEASQRLRGMILVGGHAGNCAEGSPQNKLQIPLLERGIMNAIVRRPRLGRFFTKSFFGARPADVLVEALRRSMVDLDARPILPIIRAMVDEDWYARLDAVRVPTHVICGERDRTCPRRHSERMGSDIAGARTTWLADAGHMVPYEDPTTIVDAVAAFTSRRGAAAARYTHS